MALFDCATVKRIDATYKTPMVAYRGLIVHIAVSNALFPSYQPGTKADFYIRKNGVICQEIDTRFRSGAQLNGNDSYLSVELEGGLDPGDLHAEMPQAQLESLGRLLAEAHERHGIPLRLMTDTNPRAESSRGLGFHRLGVPYRGIYASKVLSRVQPGWLQSPNHLWFSKSQGKECPGDGRIAQLPDAIDLAKGEPTAKPTADIEPVPLPTPTPDLPAPPVQEDDTMKIYSIIDGGGYWVVDYAKGVQRQLSATDLETLRRFKIGEDIGEVNRLEHDRLRSLLGTLKG